MSTWNAFQQEKENESVTQNVRDNSVAEDKWPLLYSGMVTPVDDKDDRGCLSPQFYFDQTVLMCRLMDRRANMQTFIEIQDLERAFEEVDHALSEYGLRWKPLGRGNGRGVGTF